jgi:aspartate racemase
LNQSQPCFGLIGGLGVGATVYYYEQLAKAHIAANRPMRLVMAHADMNSALRYLLAGETMKLAEYFAELAGRLRDAGATFTALPAVTPNVCETEFAAISPLPPVSIVEETRSALQSRGLRRVALFGSRYVVESSLFGKLGNVEVVKPRPEEIDFIHRTYFEIVDAAAGSAST